MIPDQQEMEATPQAESLRAEQDAEQGAMVSYIGQVRQSLGESQTMHEATQATEPEAPAYLNMYASDIARDIIRRFDAQEGTPKAADLATTQATEPETPGMFDIPLPVVNELETWERLLHSRFQSCYYRTNWGAPGDPEWVPAHVVSVQGAWKTRVRIEIQPDRGTDFADAFYRALDRSTSIGQRQSTIVIRDLSELHLLDS